MLRPTRHLVLALACLVLALAPVRGWAETAMWLAMSAGGTAAPAGAASDADTWVPPCHAAGGMPVGMATDAGHHAGSEGSGGSAPSDMLGCVLCHLCHAVALPMAEPATVAAALPAAAPLRAEIGEPPRGCAETPFRPPRTEA
jgi:hypothetical protein